MTLASSCSKFHSPLAGHFSSCFLSLRWVPLAASSGYWPACLWSSSRAGPFWSGHGGPLPNCWPSPPSSSPLACCPGSTTLHTSVASCLGSSFPSPSCPTSGVLVVDAVWCFYKVGAWSSLGQHLSGCVGIKLLSIGHKCRISVREV